MKKFLLLVALILFSGIMRVDALTFYDEGAVYNLDEIDTSCLSEYDMHLSFYDTDGHNFIFSDMYDENFVEIRNDGYCSKLYNYSIVSLRNQASRSYDVKEISDGEYGLFEISSLESARDYTFGNDKISLIHYNSTTIDNSLVYYRRTSGYNVEIVPTDELKTDDIPYYYIEPSTINTNVEKYIMEVSEEFYNLTQNSYSIEFNEKTNDAFIVVEENDKNNVYDASGKLIFEDIDRFEVTSDSLFLVYKDGSTKIYNTDKELLKTTTMLKSAYEVGYNESHSLIMGTDDEGDKLIPYLLSSYRILSGHNQTYTGENIEITLDESVWSIENIFIGDRVLVDGEYDLDYDKKIITIYSGYLDTLKNGDHTITIRFYNGTELTTNIKVVNSTVALKVINEIVITNFIEPMIGTVPTFTSTVSKKNPYVITSQSWEDGNGKYKYYPVNENHNNLKYFEDGEYIYTVYIKVNEGYNVSDTAKFYLDGKLMDYRLIKDNVYAAEYSTKAKEADVKVTNVTMPVAGKKPVYTGEVSKGSFRIYEEKWYDSKGKEVTGTFKNGEEYTYVVTLNHMYSGEMLPIYATVNDRPLKYEYQKEILYVFSYKVKLEGVPDTSDSIVKTAVVGVSALISLIAITIYLNKKKKLFN